MLEQHEDLIKRFKVKYVDKFGFDNEDTVWAMSQADALNTFKYLHEGVHNIIVMEVLM